MAAGDATHCCPSNPCPLCTPRDMTACQRPSFNVLGCDVPWPHPLNIVDYGQHEESHCQCRWAWGDAPLWCPVHNPGYSTVKTAPDTAPAFPADGPRPLAPGDIERIAQRVAELLKAGG